MIYLDYAASTPLDKRVLKKITPFLHDVFGNPSSIHAAGRITRAAIDESRNIVSDVLGCKPKEITFTSGGTESNNLAIFGLANALKDKGNHIISTQIEHHSVLEPLKRLELQGFKVTYLPVNVFGLVDLDELEKAITPKTIFASIIYANNEIGVIQNISKISEILHNKNIILHTDACQAAGYLDVTPQNLGVDLMTINGGKIYGPKGAGALYIKENIKIVPQLFGGGQEHRVRAGTENTAAIVGFAEALKLAHQQSDKDSKTQLLLREQLITGLLKRPGVFLNGDRDQRLPNNVNISIEKIDIEALLLRLDLAGVYVSTASACTSGTLEPSHVIAALGLDSQLTKSSIRFSLGRGTTTGQIKKTLKIFSKIVQELRQEN